MKRIRLLVSYDGTDYCGWQIQPNGITIEEVLNKKLKKLTGEDIHIIGASRTWEMWRYLIRILRSPRSAWHMR